MSYVLYHGALNKIGKIAKQQFFITFKMGNRYKKIKI